MLRKLPKNELYHLHVEKFYTYHQLAKHFRCSTQTIRQNIEAYDIPKAPRGNKLARHLKMSEKDLKKLLTDLYWNKGLSTQSIANQLETTQFTIWSNFQRLNIKRRPATNKSKEILN